MDDAARPSPDIDAAAVLRMRRGGLAASAASALIGAAGLAGWMTGLPWLRSWGLPIDAQPNAVLGIVLVGAGAVLGAGGGERRARAARILGALALALGAATLLEHLLGLDLWLDGALFPGEIPTPATTAPGRMGPPAALGVCLGGAAVRALASQGRSRGAAGQVLALAGVPLPLLGLVGYAYAVPALYGETGSSGIALPVAVALLLASAGLLLSRPAEGFVVHLAAHGTAGAIARRTLAYAVALPFAIGWVGLAASGEARPGAFALSLVVAALTLGLVVLVLKDAAALGRLEAARARAGADREASREALQRALVREQEARAVAEGASKARDEFLNALSHELRTPLNAILGWSRLLREGGSDPERLARGVAVLERNGRVLAQVVSDLLDMSRLARGAIQLERREVDLGAALEAALAPLAAVAAAKGVALAREVEEPAPRVEGDAARLQQVAWNLVSNALKFTPAGGRIEVSVRREGAGVVLQVEDTGDGIPPEFLPHVFERFRQADGSTTRRHGGLGLGLALTRELVILHGGTIEARSAGAGHGATFRVTLPLAAPVPEVPGVLPPARGRARLAGARILVVDDEVDSRELLLQLLASWGARPRGAGSAREAAAALEADRPDLLVSDIAMPGEDGCQLVQELRRRERALGERALPAVALTAFTRPEDRRRVLAAGFDAHVPKPVEPDELVATLSALLDRPVPGVVARPTPPPGADAGARAAG